MGGLELLLLSPLISENGVINTTSVAPPTSNIILPSISLTHPPSLSLTLHLSLPPSLSPSYPPSLPPPFPPSLSPSLPPSLPPSITLVYMKPSSGTSKLANKSPKSLARRTARVVSHRPHPLTPPTPRYEQNGN